MSTKIRKKLGLGKIVLFKNLSHL